MTEQHTPRDGSEIFLAKPELKRFSYDPAAARVPDIVAHVPQSHSGSADRFHVVAPDLPGFTLSDAPDIGGFRYTLRI